MRVLDRILEYAKKTRREVNNPRLTAREAIELANDILEMKHALRILSASPCDQSAELARETLRKLSQ